MKNIYTNEQIQEIINLYTINQYTLNDIGKKYKVSRNVIKRILLENKILLRQKTHKYKANYNIFEYIDTNEKAYWLGFLAADGCNYQRQQNAIITLNIHQKDKEHLNNFINFLNGDFIITDYISNAGFGNNTPMCKMSINSKKMSYDLADKGVVPKKSLILKPPKIDKKFFLPYILGYFDGDGSIYKLANGEFGISIEGTKELLEWINEILHISNKIEKRYNDEKNNYYIRCGGTQKPYLILKQLYDSTNVHLQRKYLIYKELETVVLSRNIKDYQTENCWKTLRAN